MCVYDSAQMTNITQHRTVKSGHFSFWETILKLECGTMPNVMAALPNIGGTLCSTPQSLADAQYWRGVQ